MSGGDVAPGAREAQGVAERTVAAMRAADAFTAWLGAVAEAELEPRRLGFYRVTVRNAAGEAVALFRGTAYDTRRPHAGTPVPRAV